MKFEKIGSIGYKKGFLYGIIITLVFVVVINLFTSLAKYRLTESVKIVDSVVSYSPYDFKIMEIYKQKEGSKCIDINGECYEKLSSTDRMPSDGYVLNRENSYCNLSDDNKDTEATLTSNESGETVISGLTVKDKCYLYYDKEMKAGDTIVDNSNFIKDEAHFDGTACLTGCDYQENGVYETEDDFGDSYYFRGTVNDNWVKFGKMGKDDNGADIYWRIIRINGDGTIRIIYAGTSSNDSAPEPIGSHTQIGPYSFNSKTDDNKYVGYQFSANSNKRGQDNNSVAYTQLMSWFGANLVDEWNDGNGKIDINAGFCGDRSSSTNQYEVWKESNMSESGGAGKTITYYGSYLRSKNNRQPTLKCGTIGTKNLDYYTYLSATGIESTINEKIEGTKSLQYPIGLITMDEVYFAGGRDGADNTSYWLYTDQSFWTMTPSYFYTWPVVWYVNLHISLYGSEAVNRANQIGLRPVINLKANTQLTFQNPDGANKGTSSNPYIVVN